LRLAVAIGGDWVVLDRAEGLAASSATNTVAASLWSAPDPKARSIAQRGVVVPKTRDERLTSQSLSSVSAPQFSG
jgi:hypothetical protein